MKQLIYKFLAITILLGSLTVGWFWMDYKQFINRTIVSAQNQIHIDIVKGDHFFSILAKLEIEKTYLSSAYLRITRYLHPELTHIKQGEYLINGPKTLMQLLQIFNQGKVYYHQIQFIEGWTFNQMLDFLSKEELIDHKSVIVNSSNIMRLLGSKYENPEGWFYPDTYNFVKNDTNLEILKVAHKKMQKVLSQYWEQRDLNLPYESPYDVLIMASIIEKETGLASERSEIAGVFVRRLNKGMRLQTDPTVIYGLGAQFNGNITKAHLRRDNPYNTYRRNGLPPTPIALPSEASIKAAVHPKDGTTLYFVSRGDGSHEFSDTIEQHNAAVRKYQLRRK